MSKIDEARDRIRRWRLDPVAFVVENFGVEPDEWQRDALAAVGGEANPKRKLCMKACTGPGKSATLAWLGWHRPDRPHHQPLRPSHDAR